MAAVSPWVRTMTLIWVQRIFRVGRKNCGAGVVEQTFLAKVAHDADDLALANAGIDRMADGVSAGQKRFANASLISVTFGARASSALSEQSASEETHAEGVEVARG